MPNDIISLTQFKSDASGWIERLQKQPPVVLTQNGEGRAVVQSYDSYRQMQDSLAMMAIVARGEADIHEGRLIPHDLVIAEVRAQLEASEPKPAGKARTARKSGNRG